MPDDPVSDLIDLLGPLAWRALRAFAATTAGTVLLGTAASITCYFVAANGSTARGLIGVAIACVSFGVLGLVLALKRAIATALIHGFEKLGLGARTTELLFVHILEIDAREAHGERGTATAQLAERVPLDRAEQRLRAAVDRVFRDDDDLGFLRRKIRQAAVDRVSALTLTRFREDNRVHGGVDLTKVRAELGSKIDATIVDAVRGAMVKVTATLLGAACFLALASAYLLRVARP